jgi:hypothetical protein
MLLQMSNPPYPKITAPRFVVRLALPRMLVMIFGLRFGMALGQAAVAVVPTTDGERDEDRCNLGRCGGVRLLRVPGQGLDTASKVTSIMDEERNSK